MSDAFHPFDESELSSEDLAVIQAFDELTWKDEISSTPDEEVHSTVQVVSADFMQEMLLVFVHEVSEDLAAMIHIRHQLEEAQPLSAKHFIPLRRGGHKIRGSAGAVNCQSLSVIAGHVEDIAELVVEQQLAPDRGLHAIKLALAALEETLESIIETGREDEDPLVRLVEPLEEIIRKPVSPPDEVSLPIPEPAVMLSPLYKPEEEFEIPFLRVKPARVASLSLHSQQFNELRASLESSQAQFAQALQELHIAQARLRQLQPLISTMFSHPPRSPLLDEHSSSLIARILSEAEQRNESGHSARRFGGGRKLRVTSGSSFWDELEIERYSEQDLLIRSLNEAIADVSLISMRVQALSAQRDLVLQRYMDQVSLMNEDVRKLRLMPLHVLLPEIRVFIQPLSAQMPTLEFDVQGEDAEVDQAVLDVLALPLLRLFQTCLSDTAISMGEDDDTLSPRIWFHAEQLNNEVTLEIGFSMPISGGALAIIREPLQRIHGSVSLRRNASDNVSFYLRFPRTYGEVHCLLVCVGAERFLISTAQVQRVSDCKREVLHTFYDLGRLLHLPATTHTDARIQPVLVLPSGNSPVLIGVTVDEVIDEMELTIKPLPTYLQRPSITSSAIDGRGNVLLLLDLPELIRSSAAQSQKMPVAEHATLLQRSDAPTILIADDSVSMRQSLHQMLSWAHYTILEARDGIMALEQLLEFLPDLLLLDIEMPNLNGYDLLRAMGSYPQLAHIKTIVLTSRSSEKHMNQARELGAHHYMTKPVAPDELLATIKNLLALS